MTPQKQKDEPRSGFPLGSLVVDGALQLGLTFWFSWIARSIFDLHFNVWLFWLASTLIYVAMYSYDNLISGRMLVFHILFLILATLYVWIFL